MGRSRPESVFHLEASYVVAIIGVALCVIFGDRLVPVRDCSDLGHYCFGLGDKTNSVLKRYRKGFPTFAHEFYEKATDSGVSGGVTSVSINRKVTSSLLKTVPTPLE